MQHGELVISSRFHAMISALSLGIPVFIIGWSHKYQEVLQMFGLEANQADFQGLSEEALSKGIEESLKNQSAIRSQIQKHLPEVIRSAHSQFERINFLID